MRDTRFRGKRKDNGEWTEGSLIYHEAYDLNDGVHKPEPEHCFIRLQQVTWVGIGANKCWTRPSAEVDPETVGQFTGLKDKEGKDVFEGDVVAWASRQDSVGFKFKGKNAVVTFAAGIFYAEYQLATVSRHVKVIGNIHSFQPRTPEGD